jgi:competence protein ComEC
MGHRVAAVACCLLVVLSGCAGLGVGPDGAPADGTATPAGSTGITPPPNGTLEAHVVDVGQADATLLRTDEETMLIDSGDWRDDGETVLEYLDALGVDRIDHLVSTHAHADHIGGHEAIIDHYETEREGVGAVYDSGVTHTSRTYERYLDAVERHDVTLFEVRSGDEIPLDGAAATVLSPSAPVGDDLHDNGVSVSIAVGETSFLFTGDAEREAESRLLEAHGDRLDVDVYQAGHHGSNTSSGPAFLDAVDPAVAVVSSGYDSQFGHPHDEPLKRFAERDIRTVWTGVHGSIVFESDGERIVVRTQVEATTDPLELNTAPEASADPTDPTAERFAVGVAA